MAAHEYFFAPANAPPPSDPFRSFPRTREPRKSGRPEGAALDPRLRGDERSGGQCFAFCFGWLVPQGDGKNRISANTLSSFAIAPPPGGVGRRGRPSFPLLPRPCRGGGAPGDASNRYRAWRSAARVWRRRARPPALHISRLFFVPGPRFPNPLPGLISQLLAGGS